MPKLKPSYAEEKSDNILILISDIKARKHLRDAEIAKMMQIPRNTLIARKQDPSTFRMREIWNFMQAAGVAEERKQEIL